MHFFQIHEHLFLIIILYEYWQDAITFFQGISSFLFLFSCFAKIYITKLYKSRTNTEYGRWQKLWKAGTTSTFFLLIFMTIISQIPNFFCASDYSISSKVCAFLSFYPFLINKTNILIITDQINDLNINRWPNNKWII